MLLIRICVSGTKSLFPSYFQHYYFLTWSTQFDIYLLTAIDKQDGVAWGNWGLYSSHTGPEER